MDAEVNIWTFVCVYERERERGEGVTGGLKIA